MMNSQWCGSIKTKISLALFFVVTCILTLFGIWEYFDTRTALTKELNDLAEITINRLAENLRLPLWEVDNAWASKIVMTEMRNKKIYAIFVSGAGDLSVRKARNAHWQPVGAVDDIQGNYVIRSRAVMRKDENIGSVKLYITKKFMAEQLRKDTLSLLLTVILLGVSISAFLALMLHRIIIRPINKIRWIADAIAAGDYSKSIEVSQKDEIGILASRFNSMKEKIRLREMERDEAEQELYRHREHLEDLVRHRTEDLNTAQRIAHLGNWVWEKSSDRITWSDEIYRIFGFEPQQIKASYEEFLNRVHPEDREEVLKSFNESQKAGKPYKMDHRIVRPNGLEGIVYAQGEVTLDESRKPVRMVGTVQDITERVRTEQALRDSERRLAEIIDFLPEATLVVDTEGKIMAWNRALEKMTGVSSGDVLGKGDYEYAMPFYGERRPMLIDVVARRDKVTDQDYMNLQEDGETLIADESYCPNLGSGGAFVSATARLLYDSRGNRVGAIESVRDITWRKQLEQQLVAANRELELRVEQRTAALRQSEERFRAIFETAEDCIFVKNQDLKYTHMNPAMLKLLGMQAEEILGKTDREIFQNDLAAQFMKMEARVLKGQSIESEHTISWKEDLMTLSSLRVPMSDLSGNRVGLCGIVRDVTVWRKAGSQFGVQQGGYTSPAINFTLHQLLLAAETDSTVLFLGESGSGKDYLAKYLHDRSLRRNGPFFAINCAAVAPELAESELFGHEAGAFTGTRGRKRGLLELAEGGTLLLNEIGELPLGLQAKLLAFLDTQSFLRVGGHDHVTINARIIAATNRDLARQAEAGNFREDLFYRLNVFPIKVPPLRERADDLPQLVQNLLGLLSKKLGFHPVPRLDDRTMKKLSSYHWPGNIRELRNVLERALILCNKKKITEKDLAMLHETKTEMRTSTNDSFVVAWSAGISMNEVLNQTKRSLIEEGLLRCGGSIKETASLLGISRGSLKHYLHYLGIHR